MDIEELMNRPPAPQEPPVLIFRLLAGVVERAIDRKMRPVREHLVDLDNRMARVERSRPALPPQLIQRLWRLKQASGRPMTKLLAEAVEQYVAYYEQDPPKEKAQ